MEITLNKSIIILGVLKFPFEVQFSFNGNKQNGDKPFYFTKGGKCRIKVYTLRMDHESGGKISEETYDGLMKNMKKYKSDILVDVNKEYYTTGNNSLIHLPELSRTIFMIEDYARHVLGYEEYNLEIKEI
jgi:hypothetical protein